MKLRLAHLLILTVACGAVFSNVFDNGFHWDDNVRVQDNPGVTQFWPPWRHFVDPTTSATASRLQQYRPLLPLSLSINHAISGDSLVGYHVGNLLLHLLAAIAVYLALVELLAFVKPESLSPHAPLCIALLFAVHPVSGIPVNYICGRDLAIMQMFLFGALAVYVRMRRLGETGRRLAICLALFLGAMLAKKNAIALPGLLLLFEVLVARQPLGSRRTWRRVLPFVIVAALLLAFIGFGLGFSDFDNVVTTKNTSPGEYFVGQLQHHVFHYLAHFVWPFPMRLQPDWTHVAWQQVVGGLVILGSWFAAWKLRHAQPLVAFGILGYQALLLLTSSVLPLVAEIVPYRPYPSSPLLFLALGIPLLAARHGQTVLLALALYFGIAAFTMNGIWATDESLWSHSVDHGGNDRAHVSLARVETDQKRRIALYREAIRQNPSNGDAVTELAQLKGDLSTLAAGVESFPDIAEYRVRYAQGLAAAGKRQDALAQLQTALRLEPSHREARWLAATLLVETQQYQTALQVLDPLLRNAPNFRSTLMIAATANFNLNRPDQALPLLQRYVEIRPKHDQGWFNLGLAFLTIGQPAQAIAPLSTCVRVNPKFKEAYALLARAHRETGDTAEAARLMQIYGRLR